MRPAANAPSMYACTAMGAVLSGSIAQPRTPTVVILEPGWEIAELPRAATPEEAVQLALAAVG